MIALSVLTQAVSQKWSGDVLLKNDGLCRCMTRQGVATGLMQTDDGGVPVNIIGLGEKPTHATACVRIKHDGGIWTSHNFGFTLGAGLLKDALVDTKSSPIVYDLRQSDFADTLLADGLLGRAGVETDELVYFYVYFDRCNRSWNCLDELELLMGINILICITPLLVVILKLLGTLASFNQGIAVAYCFELVLYAVWESVREENPQGFMESKQFKEKHRKAALYI
mmetsp:Transcript_16985/g.29232  ORF Transcript_16985/g.29232 Transcript_16985/m.29232 type:complete len:225 (-) Transcript_16985:4219-4893(-)